MRRAEKLENITAAILVGGKGTRLRSMAPDRPKPLVEIRGRPFLSYLLDQLSDAGIKSVVLCTGYLAEQVETEFGNLYGTLRLVYSRESFPLGTAGAIRFAMDMIDSEPVLVMNGDSYCEVDLRAFWSWHCDKQAAASLVLTEVPDTKRYGRVHANPDGSLVGFNEKGGEGGPGWINAGVYFLTRDVILSIPLNRRVSLEVEILPAWIGRNFYGYQRVGRFLDIGTPESYAVAEEFFLLDKRRRVE